MKRPDISDEILLKAIEALTINVGKHMEAKGRGAFVSNHEFLGVVTEEYSELTAAVQSNDPMNIAQELLDVATAAVFSFASMVLAEESIKQVQEELTGMTETVH